MCGRITQVHIHYTYIPTYICRYYMAQTRSPSCHLNFTITIHFEQRLAYREGVPPQRCNLFFAERKIFAASCWNCESRTWLKFPRIEGKIKCGDLLFCVRKKRRQCHAEHNVVWMGIFSKQWRRWLCDTSRAMQFPSSELLLWNY